MTIASRSPQLDFARSFDGTMIATRVIAGGGRTPVLICNAIGATLVSFERVLTDVVRERAAATWDLRGLFDSSAPVSYRIDAGAHAEDALAALDRHGIDRVVVIAWSTGSRIALEIAHRYPERTAALSLVCGGYGHPPARLVQFLELPSLLPVMAGVAKHFSGPLQQALRALAARPEIAGLIRQSGLIAASADTAALVELLRGLARCDVRVLLDICEEVVGDGAAHLLNSIEAPTLLVAGERDRFTPLRMMEDMARAILEARLVVYDGATHYLPIEFPARLSDDLRKFWADAGV